MKYGIYFPYWEHNWDGRIIPYISKVKSLGFDILEFSVAAITEASNEELDEIRRAARDQELILTAGYGPKACENIASADPDIRANAISFYTNVLKKLERLDVHTIGGGIYSYWPVDYTQPIDKAGDWARSVEGVRQVSLIAGECGVDYCLEVLNRFEGYLLNTAKECRRFVDEVDTPAVKVMLDTFHMNIEEDSFYDAILTAGDKLGHFHVGENNRRTPGTGFIPWSEIGSALNRIGYKGGVVMEPFVMPGGQVGSDIKVFRDIISDTSESALDKDAANSVSFLRHVFQDTH